MASSATSSADVPDLVPARMLNEFTYCPRLAWLEWVQGDFVDSADTVDGRRHHRRVDRPTGDLPTPDDMPEDREQLHARSVHLSSPSAGLVARIDLVEANGVDVTPIDYKRGEAPDVPEGAWEPERVQLCAQGLILEDNGYSCREGVLYFAGSRRRVTIPFTPELRARTLELLGQMRETMAGSTIPPPLDDSPKCPRCSLVGICLPDEVNLLRTQQAEPEADPETPRKLVPARDDALPVYVQAAGTRVGKSGEEITIEPREGEKQTARLAQTSQLALFGAVQISTQALHAIVGRGIPVCYFSTGGWFHAITTGLMHKNVELRRSQFRIADDPVRSLALARRFVGSKIRNCRTFLRRNSELSARSLDALKVLANQADQAESPASLLGIEGSAAREYFQRFSGLLKRTEEEGLAFDFDGRNRRPPKDPVNAMLSLAYAVLAKDLTVVLQAVGFDPYLGFYHRPRYGRPALALDLMEEFRPLIADSVVVNAINTGVVRRKDFIVRGGAYALTPPGRARLLQAYERRMDELITHPVFGYRISYRRVLEVQARLLARHLAGEIPEFPGFETR